MASTRFSRFVWGALAYNLAVIVWGAYVRATGSGAGCGGHWPLCDGAVIPRTHAVATLIEITHRLSTTPLLPLAIVVLVWAYRLFPRRHPARAGAWFCLAFTCTEALFGAVLVRFGLVAQNASAARAALMAAHLTNSFILLGALAVTAVWGAADPQDRATAPLLPRWRGQGALGYALFAGLLATLGLAITGAITALGDTLFPARTLAQGIAEDLSPTAHFLLHLRPLHPLIAVSVGIYALLISGLVSHLRPAPLVRRVARWPVALFGVELGLGLINLLLRAPVAMQLVHLYVADLLWISMVVLTAIAIADGIPVRADAELGVEPSISVAGPYAATWKDYIALTKPRVISLLLFTTLAAAFIAARDTPGHVPGAWLLLALAVGGYMAAGAANAINMVLERDLDVRMDRTARRPTVTDTIPPQRALGFAFALAAGSFALLWYAANLLCALLALAGLAFYVIVYTLGLKRRTWQNIVIGGAAGAFPPLVGWAAVTGKLSILAWYLFGIILVWTPVHFWSLALLIKEDYARAGVPMLPVVRGERVTVIQIMLYSGLTCILSILPFLQRQVGLVYLTAAILLNAALVARTVGLYRQPARPQARSLFHYSMVYLALLFLMMAVDRTVRF